MALVAVGFSAGATAVEGVSGDPTDPEVQKKKEAVILTTVIGYLKRIHLSHLDLDDDFSERIFDSYLNRLDGQKRFFIQEEVDAMNFYRDKIDDEVTKSSFTFFNMSVNLLDRGVERSNALVNDILAEPFNLHKEEQFETDPEKRSYASNEEELHDIWRKRLKMETLRSFYSKKEAQEEEGFEGELLNDTELEEAARKVVQERWDGSFERVKKLRRSDRFATFINAITNAFDPHSDYFSPKEKEDFDINMSGRLEGIGARLSLDKNSVTKVVSIVPGGPAWKQGDLEVDDLITAVKQDGEEPVDVQGWRIDDVVQLIRGKKGTKVFLTVKKVDGSSVEVMIERDEVILEDGRAKSAIVQEEGTDKRYGYLYLPRFYADFERQDGRSCAKDVEMELKKLKEEGVDGIVFDLRSNGGGSLRDVVDMSGLFIEEGPIVQVKAQEEKARVYNDTNRSVAYDGPVVVLVNQYSASASEILAAALQDYDRAVIVGSTSTFGKGSVQRFYSLDRSARGADAELVKPLGDVKLTTQLFYRVDGGSTQLKGVEPDIVLPDNYNYLKVGERRYDNPMEWTEIDPVEHNQNVYTIDNMDELRKLSQARVEKHPEFQLIDDYAHKLKEKEDDSVLELSYEAYAAEEEQSAKEAETFKKIMKEPIAGLIVKNLKQDFSEIESDESKKARNDDWLENLQKDIYIFEGMQILDDLNDNKLASRRD